MIGRAAYSNPWFLADDGKTRAEVVHRMVDYARRQDSLRHVTRHMLGLYHATPRARLWRRMLSDSARARKERPGAAAARAGGGKWGQSAVFLI